MKLYGYEPVRSVSGTRPLPSSGRSTVFSFQEELQKTTEAAAVKKAADTLDLSQDSSLRALCDQLTPASKDVLERMKDGKNDIKKEEWTAFCKELETLGAITESDFTNTRSDLCLIPIGYRDQDGSYVLYEDCPPMRDHLESAGGRAQNNGQDGLWACVRDDGWKGDPLAYLDSWITSLDSWRNSLARMQNEDGSPKYGSLSPLTNKIQACQTVSGLVRELWKF
nr:hypothetical protein [uncultured Oscillibacter sp.]